MPFQSEKQRRYLHANHPEIAKRWERDYAHGGILDINESEEIISDDGNEIELTDYNAAFDEPTGVQSLFQAKEGGTPRRRYFTGAYGGGNPNEDRAAEESRASRGPRDDPDRFGPTTTSRSRIQDEKQEDFRQKEMAKTIATGPGSPIEKYDTQAQHLADLPGTLGDNPYKSRVNVNYKTDNYQQTLANQKAKLKNMGLQKLIPLFLMIAFGVPPMDALKAFPKTISITPGDMRSLITHGLPVMKAKKELIEALEIHQGGLLKDVDITNPNEMVILEETTDFIDTRDQLADLTKTREEDDTKGDGPTLPPQLGGPSTEEMAIEYRMSDLDRIRAGQAKYAAYIDKIEREKLAREDNPIVSGTEMDIIALRNSGGLANLFRVKNQ